MAQLNLKSQIWQTNARFGFVASSLTRQAEKWGFTRLSVPLSLSLIVSSFCVPVNLPMSQLPPYKARQERGVTHDYQTEDDEEAGEKSKRKKPEPKEDVDLFVDNVDRQKAEGVVGLT